MPKEQIKECPRCSKSFICSMHMHCWCVDVIIPDKVQEYISALYNDCLCKSCLEELIREFSNNKKATSI